MYFAFLKQWNALYHEAATSLLNRDENIQKVAELIEKNLIILGATAIEDKLQIVIIIQLKSHLFKLFFLD